MRVVHSWRPNQHESFFFISAGPFSQAPYRWGRECRRTCRSRGTPCTGRLGRPAAFASDAVLDNNGASSPPAESTTSPAWFKLRHYPDVRATGALRYDGRGFSSPSPSTVSITRGRATVERGRLVPRSRRSIVSRRSPPRGRATPAVRRLRAHVRRRSLTRLRAPQVRPGADHA